MAKFKKGESGNPEGKTPGTLNRSTQEVRTKIENVLSEHFDKDQLAADLKAVKPYERWNLFLKLLEFVVPRMRASELKIEFEQFSDQDLDKIINGLINKADG